eukprot:6259789-Alexandrium_andersonii.AAC.1
MSASLVGSEMCIRDSVACCALRVACWVVAPLRLGDDAFASLRRCAIASSVSYTHLTLPTICSV